MPYSNIKSIMWTAKFFNGQDWPIFCPYLEEIYLKENSITLYIYSLCLYALYLSVSKTIFLVIDYVNFAKLRNLGQIVLYYFKFHLKIININY